MGYVDNDGRHIEADFNLEWPCCRYKATGEIFEYFVYRSPFVDDDGDMRYMMLPEWYNGDVLELNEGDVVINHIGVGIVRGNKSNPSDVSTIGEDYMLVGKIERVFQYLENR